MSFQYPLSYLTLSAACGGVLYVTGHTRWWWLGGLAAWVGISFVLLAILYILNVAGPLGKTARGGRWIWAWPLFWPYLLLSECAFLLARRSGQILPYSEIAPGLYVGRRLTRAEADELVRTVGIRGVVDLAAEFGAVPIFRSANYLSLPVLDAMTPSPAQVTRAVEWIDRVRRTGPVYLHCALGHSRSATVAAAYLVSAGLAKNATDAIRTVRTARPGVKLHPAQRAVIASFRRAREPSRP